MIVEPAAPAQLFVHGGGWRVAAKQYGLWLKQGLNLTARKAPHYLDHQVMTKDSAWVPNSAIVAANKKQAEGTALTSFAQLYDQYYAGNTIDMLEFAMWWEGVAGNLTANVSDLHRLC
eukprot:SAG22_NODE_96_length_20771_cov_33.186018_3_plen_118_part_00